MTLKQIVVAAVCAVTGAGLSAPSASAQGFTFGPSAEREVVREPAHHGRSVQPSRKPPAQTNRCRSERHQVYDAQSQLVWRTLRVCG